MDEYAKALADMGAESLERYEPKGNGHGGARIHPPGSKAPGPKPFNPNGPQVKVTVRIDPDYHRLVTWHATARGNSFNASLNQLLGEALRSHEVDAE